LEVILATAILLAATVTLARVAFITTQHAQRAEDRTVALQIADYQMQRLLLGQLPVQNRSRGPVLEILAEAGDTQAAPHPWDTWHFAVQIAATTLPSLYRVQVDVYRLPPGAVSTSGSSSPDLSPSENLAAPTNRDASESGTTAAGTVSRDRDSLFQYSVVRLIQVDLPETIE
jgi:type II secretory pathway component PulJ